MLDPLLKFMNLNTNELKNLNDARTAAKLDKPIAPPKKGLFW